MTEKIEQEAKTEQIDREIEVLDREAREALDRLADRREELARRHRSTELAERRSRERQEERRRRELQEAEKKAQEKARARRVEISEERRALVAELEGLADRISEGLRRLEGLDGRLVEELASHKPERANELARALPGKSQRWLKEQFGWFGV